MSQRDDFGLEISSGLVRHQDGTFGVYVLLSFAGWGDGGPLRNVLADESGAPVSFATEREAQIAAFDMMEDIGRDATTRYLVEASARFALWPWGARASSG